MRTALAALVVVSFAASALLGQTAKKAVLPPVAVVTDEDGQVTTVTNLKARYITYGKKKENGTYAATVDLATLFIELTMWGDSDTSFSLSKQTKEALKIPLSTIRRLTFSNMYTSQFTIEVKRRNATTLVIKPLESPEYQAAVHMFVLEERDSSGQVTRRQKLYEEKMYILAPCGQAGKLTVMCPAELCCFTGTIQAPGGRTRQFTSKHGNVTVEFK